MLIDVIWALVYCTTLWYLCKVRITWSVFRARVRWIQYYCLFFLFHTFIIFTCSTRPIHLRTVQLDALLNFLCKWKCKTIKNCFSLARSQYWYDAVDLTGSYVVDTQQTKILVLVRSEFTVSFWITQYLVRFGFFFLVLFSTVNGSLLQWFLFRYSNSESHTCYLQQRRSRNQ